MRYARLLSPDEQGGETESLEQVEDAPEEVNPLAHAVARYRGLVAAMPGLVPEMVQGDTIEEVDASAEVARQAYSAISQRIAEAHEAHVPAGNPARSAADMSAASLKPEAKIALGLRGK